jgi:hypothetical protein
MLLSMMLVLAVASAIFEISIAHKVPFYRKLAGRYLVINLVGSMVLSFVMGLAFGAAGLVVMGAGIISTVLVIPYYKGIAWWDNGGAETWAQFRQTMTDFGNLIYKLIRFMTFPFRALRWISAKYRGAS